MKITPHFARAASCAVLIMILLTQHDSGRRREPVESGGGSQTAGRLNDRGSEPDKGGRSARR